MLTRRWPLWLQLTSAMVVASVAVAYVAGHYMRAVETDFLRDDLHRESQRASEALTLNLAAPGAAADENALRRLAEDVGRRGARIYSVALIDGAGRSVRRWVLGDQVDPGQVFYFGIPADIPGRGQGQVVVSWNVAELVDNIQQHVARLQVNVFFTVGLLSGVLVVLVHFLVIRPVERLRSGLDRLSQGDVDTRIRLSRFAASELDQLANSLTELGQYQRALGEVQASLERARTDAEAASEAKGRFLAVMSHEIRTPINGIVGSLDLLADARLGATEANLLANAQRSADSLLEIINEILDFSRIEAGRLELERVEFQLESQLNDVAGSISGLVDPSRVELVVDFDAGLPGRVIGDPLRLRQVLTNLLGNAAKFTSEGTIMLRAYPLANGRVCIQVMDTGIGVPHERQVALFDPFIQADSSTTRQYGGTGLGLSIVKQLVELMGGSISLESEPGAGSTFSIELPLDTVEPPRSFDLPHLAGQVIPVLERDEHAAAALSGYIASLGARALVARDAEEAFRIAGEAGGQVRYLVLDARLAEASGGGGFVHALRAAGGDENTRVVLMVAPGTVIEETAVYDVTLLKPVKRDSLAAALSEASAPVTERVEPETAQESGKKNLGRVLVVDDNAMNVQVAVAMLERLGLEAESASGGEEGLACLASRDFDVVLMDEQMPGMDGLEATRRLREREAGSGRGTPVVALTANADREAEQRCLDAGMDGFLAKPVRRGALRKMLARWIADLPPVDGSADTSAR